MPSCRSRWRRSSPAAPAAAGGGRPAPGGAHSHHFFRDVSSSLIRACLLSAAASGLLGSLPEACTRQTRRAATGRQVGRAAVRQGRRQGLQLMDEANIVSRVRQSTPIVEWVGCSSIRVLRAALQRWTAQVVPHVPSRQPWSLPVAITDQSGLSVCTLPALKRKRRQNGQQEENAAQGHHSRGQRVSRTGPCWRQGCRGVLPGPQISPHTMCLSGLCKGAAGGFAGPGAWGWAMPGRRSTAGAAWQAQPAAATTLPPSRQLAPLTPHPAPAKPCLQRGQDLADEPVCEQEV